eukprot:3537498-Rhodomonas_salina.1
MRSALMVDGVVVVCGGGGYGDGDRDVLMRMCVWATALTHKTPPWCVSVSPLLSHASPCLSLPFPSLCLCPRSHQPPALPASLASQVVRVLEEHVFRAIEEALDQAEGPHLASLLSLKGASSARAHECMRACMCCACYACVRGAMRGTEEAHGQAALQAKLGNGAATESVTPPPLTGTNRDYAGTRLLCHVQY